MSLCELCERGVIDVIMELCLGTRQRMSKCAACGASGKYFDVQHSEKTEHGQIT